MKSRLLYISLVLLLGETAGASIGQDSSTALSDCQQLKGTYSVITQGQVYQCSMTGVTAHFFTSPSGQITRITWIGHRRVDCARHPDPRRAWPVRVSVGAFGDGLPRRDLWLSPDHAVFVDRVLIPIKHLINGCTITLTTGARFWSMAYCSDVITSPE